MNRIDKRRYPRRRVSLAATVAAGAPPTSVIDLSEGGASVEWNLPHDVAFERAIRLRFLLPGDQSIEIEGHIVHLANGRAGIEFAADQQDLVRQLMAELQSED